MVTSYQNQAAVVFGHAERQFHTIPVEVGHQKGLAIYPLAWMLDLGEMNETPLAPNHLCQLHGMQQVQSF
jgi:hypothetical protein